MNIATLSAISLALIGLSVIVRGMIQGRPGERWVWYTCGLVMVGAGAYQLAAHV